MFAVAQTRVQPEDALGHAHARRQRVLFKRLRDEVVRAGGHRFEVVRLPGARGQQNDVGIVRAPLRPDAAAEFQPVEVGHHPVRDDERKLAAVPCFPGFAAIGRLMHIVSKLPQRGVEQQPGDVVVIGDQNLHVSTVDAACRVPASLRQVRTSLCGKYQELERGCPKPASVGDPQLPRLHGRQSLLRKTEIIRR